jgi:hypothetical protein
MHINGFVRGSSSPDISRPTRRPDRASRCHLRRAGSCNTMSARRRAAPPTRSGTRKTYSKFTRTTWNSAASATATGCGSPAARARRRLTDRVAGVIYTTFYYPETQANVITSLPLGDQLPGIQGHLRAGLAVERSVALAGGL